MSYDTFSEADYYKSIPYSKKKFCNYCKNNDGSRKIIDRDVNGAINITNKFIAKLKNEPIERFERKF